ncbi:hypothetical protein ACHAXT_003812 [Thalassiosira profunda]
MSDTRSQLAEVDALIAASPDDPSLQQLREDLLQLIALEEQESAGQAQPAHAEAVADETKPSAAEVGNYAEQGQPADAAVGASESATYSEQQPSEYTAQGTFMEHAISRETIAEAPDLGSFQPVVYSSSAKAAAKSAPEANGETANLKDDAANDPHAATAAQPEKKKKKKKKKSEDAVLESTFELPSHLVQLESDTPAQKLKKQRTAKALKSKFRAKQKEAEHAKRQSDWKSFATKVGKKKKGGVPGGRSMFSTEEGVNARVGVVSGGGGRKMTDFGDTNKRHKF